MQTAYAARNELPDFTFPELNSDQGTQTADYLRNAANAAANVVCDLYEAYPSGIIPSFGDPTGIGAFTDGLLNRLCAPRGKTPAPPTSPFNGGQCVCVSYQVTYSYTGFGIPDGGGQATIPGPVGALEQNAQEGGFTQYGFSYGADGCGGRQFFGIISSALPGSVTIGGVVRVDGNPDNCGSIPPEYPPVVIPPGAFQPNVTINLPGGAVSVPVVVIPTLIRPTLNLRPELNVKVGAINVNINLGGIDLSADNSGGTSITLPPGDSRPNPPTPTAPKEPICEPVDLEPVLELLEDIKECSCEPEKVLRSTVYGAAGGRSINIPLDTQFITLDIVDVGGIKMQVGTESAPDVYFAGWYSFGRGGVGGERIPISFVDSGILAPSGASTFSYSLNFDASAVLTVFYLEESS